MLYLLLEHDPAIFMQFCLPAVLAWSGRPGPARCGQPERRAHGVQPKILSSPLSIFNLYGCRNLLNSTAEIIFANSHFGFVTSQAPLKIINVCDMCYFKRAFFSYTPFWQRWKISVDPGLWLHDGRSDGSGRLINEGKGWSVHFRQTRLERQKFCMY